MQTVAFHTLGCKVNQYDTQAMLEKFKGMGWRKIYMIFSLTDETYALLAGVKAPEGVDEKGFYFTIALLDQIEGDAARRAAAIAASLRPDAAALRACERRVRARLAQAAAWGDPALERICAAWLRTYGGCRNTLADREQGTPHASHHS